MRSKQKPDTNFQNRYFKLLSFFSFPRIVLGLFRYYQNIYSFMNVFTIQIAQIDTSITVEGTFDEHDYRSAAVIVHMRSFSFSVTCCLQYSSVRNKNI